MKSARWVLALLILTGCKIFSSSSPSQSTLRIALGSDPIVIDPQLAESGVAVVLAEQVTSTLLEVDASLHIQVKDAAHFEWLARGHGLRVEIKKDLLWSDGKPVTACQYRDGILRALDPALLTPYADIFFDIRGAEEAKTGRGPRENVAIRCRNDEGSLSFDLKNSYSSKILYALSFVASAPARLDLMPTAALSWLLPAPGRTGVSNGPFVVSAWEHDQRVTLRKRDNAPVYDRAQLSEIQMPIVRDANTAFTLYESDQLDVLDELPPAQLKNLVHRSDRHTSPWLTTYMVGFSFRANPIVRNVNFRRALAKVAHQEEIPLLLPGGEEPAYGWVPPALLPPEYRARHSLYDPAAAKKSLSQSPPLEPRALEIYFNSGERHKLLMERLAHNFGEHLKVKTELHPIDWKLLLSTLKLRAPDLYRYAWTAVYPDVMFFLEMFHSKNINNFGAYRNAEYDRLVTELAATELSKRDKIFWGKVQRCQEILTTEDPAIIPIYHYVKNTLIKARVKGLSVSPLGLTPLKHAHF